MMAGYGKGSEIWPPTNQDSPIQLQDSFPNGLIPDIVVEQKQLQQFNNPITTKRTWLDRLPFGLPLLLILTGGIRPMDIGLVLALTLYTAALSVAAQSMRGQTTIATNPNNNLLGDSIGTPSSMAPTLPSLPPQGHIPQMVENPMQDLTYSFGYDMWWRCGILLGFFAPLISFFYYKVAAVDVTSGMDIVANLARPLFLLSCQAISELIAKDWWLPLPIRIWIPIGYQVTRLVYLALGFASLIGAATATSATVTPFANCMVLLTGLNLAYTIANVFGFLLPVALMKYMRAHFFGVEAASVEIHPGMEETVGLSVHE